MSRLLRLLACLVLCVGTASAQPSPPGGSGSDRANPEGGSGDTLDSVLEAIESGSRMLIEQVQPGEERDLVENPRFDGQESPRAAVMTFTEAMDLVGRGYEALGYERALGSLPPGSTREDADALYSVFLRLGPVSPATLPGTDQARKSGDTRYEFFPRGTDHLWVWQELEEPPTGEVAVVQGADGRWVFSAATMRGLGDLADAMEPLPPRYGEGDGGAYFLKVFSPLFEETGAAGWIGFLGVTALGLALGVGFARLVSWLASRSSEDDRGMIATTLSGLGAAGGTLIFAVCFTVALGFLTLGPVLRPLRFDVPRFLIVVALALLIVSVVDTIAAFARRRTADTGEGQFREMVVVVLRRIVRTLIIGLAILFVLQNTFGMNVGALLFGFGAIALALSLAAQDTVKNLFGAVSIFVNRPFVIGDWVRFKGVLDSHWGVVRDIQLQATKIEDVTGNVVTIPNMLFIDREVENLSAREHIRREVNIAIPYRPDAREAEKACEALMDVFTDPEVVEDAKSAGRDGQPVVAFAEFAEAWLTIRGYHFYYMGDEDEDTQRETPRGYFTWLEHCSLVNKKIVDVFGQRDIEFAFPTQTVELIRGDDRE